MPGYTLLVPKPLSFILPFLIRHFDLGKMQQKMHEQWLSTAPMCIALGSSDDWKGWLAVGQAFERIAVTAQKDNLRIGIMGAPIEMDEYANQLQNLMGMTRRPAIFFRVGYAEPMPEASPRLSLNKTILS